ncbi:hypothetical protein GOP47_0020263 [Adiantum capillus-veneris]|uniref:ATP-dependent DNA helicase PIF1 n=1 Tax=Adiantum capillus-veneris TaxID=13818 RepID=A0A9D4UDL3_ADICA|nr:hypothetical protein GOP47_0020263 [Adiantum capillus-veneris]
MAESLHSMEEESFTSPSQLSLTQEQRDRISKQKELALARRSAKAEALPSPINPPSSHKDGDLALLSSFRAADGLNKVRTSRFFPPFTEPTSFLSGAALNPFLKSARKPFTPPLVIDLDDVSHGRCADYTSSYNANDMQSRTGHRPSFGADSAYTNGPMSSFDADQQRKHDESVPDSGQSGDDGSDVLVASNGSGERKQWLWLPVKTKPTLQAGKNDDGSRRPRVRARREGQNQRRRERSTLEDSTPESNDDGWRSVRKRTSPGSIFGHVHSHSLHKDTPHVQNTQMHAAMHIGSKLLSSKKPQVKFAMSSQQRKVLLAIASGKSIFITGSAGTGKSYLLHEAVNTLKNMHGSLSVFVTASTGLAGCAIGGTTLHSFAGIGLGIGEKRELANKVSSKREARKRWIDCKALIIDEISMIDGELFDKLEYIARAVRGPAFKDKVFGGIQLVVTGDFFQLPPVHPENPDRYFAFQAECWNDCFDFQVELTHVFRQSDSEFVEMLNELRRGQCSSSTHCKLSSCDRPVQASNAGILMTKLYPRKMDVGKENEYKLRSLNQEAVAFLAKDDSKSEFAMRQLENVRAEKELYLSVGAQVMLVKNVDSSSGLVNGARGVVVRFASIDELEEGKDVAKKLSPSGLWPVVLFACDGAERLLKPESWSVMDGNTEVAKRTQIPLILAWALSVHKCQGMTLDRVEIDLSKSFEYGMVYVALSRVKCLEGLRLIGFDPSLIKVHSKVVQFYEELKTGELL